MSELKHWLDQGSEADEFERAILRAGLEADPPEAKRDQVWSGLMTTLAIAPLAAATTTATASAEAAGVKAAASGVSKAAAVWLSVGKGFLVGLAIYGAAQGVNEIANRVSTRPAPALTVPQPTPRARATSRGAEPLSVASAAALALSSEDAPSLPRFAQRDRISTGARTAEHVNPASALPSVATFTDSEHPDLRVSQLEAETRALRRARDELRANELADAFATLEASRRQFSAPELYQEREALTIELLYRSGQAAAASERARAFLSRFPESPHAQQIRRFAGP